MRGTRETMGRERWEREREGLRKLARVFAEEARGGLLGEALEVILEGANLEAGAAFSVEGSSVDFVAERGFSSTSDRPSGGGPIDPFRRALEAAAERAVSARKPVFIAALSES